MASRALVDTQPGWNGSTHMTSAINTRLGGRRKRSHCPLHACLPLMVWPTGTTASELAKSLTPALELQRLEVRRDVWHSHDLPLSDSEEFSLRSATDASDAP